MQELIRDNLAVILVAAGSLYGGWKLWPSISWFAGKALSIGGSVAPAKTRQEAFNALEVLRVHFKDNARGMKAVQEAGAAFWEESGA